MTDFSNILENVPNFRRYITVDELHQRNADLVNEHPDKVELIDLGRSTNGEVIDCLQIGDGKYNALIHGFPNCEEPFGGNLLDYFAEALVLDDEFRESMDYTWYLVKCSDPDGARLNEGFHTGPHTPINFTLNYYRTPNTLTAESCFPYRFGPLDLNEPVPETKALMQILDRVPMSFISSLHMMKWGGITYEVPEPCEPIYPGLWSVAKQFNVFPRKRLGTTYAPGIQYAAYLSPARGWVQQWNAGNRNIEPIKGCYIYEYAQMVNPNAFMMIPECCIWYDPRMWDDTPLDATLGESILYAKEREDEVNNYMLRIWNEALPYLKTGSPFKVMMDEWMEPIINKYTNVTNPPFSFNKRVQEKQATMAEKIGVEGRDDLYRMFYLGGLIRTFEAELETGGSEKLDGLCVEVMGKLQEYDNYLHDSYTVTAHPIRNLVGISLGSILYSAEYAKSKQKAVVKGYQL
ncbi:MAG: M14 family zinc carboxypeptidase [Candidatus Bathyarchaeota archaeon]